MDLKARDIVVRDDPAATKLYYRFLDQQALKLDTFEKVG